MAGIGDLVNSGKQILLALSAIEQALRAVFPRVSGTFTLGAANSTTVTQANIQANSMVFFTPTNAAAATLMSGAKSLYHDVASNVAGTSFKVKTADGNNAAGTETFEYFVLTPS